MKRVTFVPRHVAEKINAQEWFEEGVVSGHVAGISIVPPEEGAIFTIDDGWQTFAFDDTETPCAGLVMFDIPAADQIIEFAQMACADTLIIHCEAGMSRSAAVALWLADNLDYELWMHPDDVGTTAHHNRHVYRTLDAATGKDLSAYYAEIERQERMMM